MKSDHEIIRDYVTAMDHMQYAFLPEGVVAITMSHSNLPAKHPDIRLNLHTTIAEVKERFRLHIGTPVNYQRLILKDNGQIICEMNDDTKKLGFYGVESGMEIHILDTDPFSLSRNGGLTDVSLVEKYRLSDEAYENRKGTMREFLREKKKLNPNFKLIPKQSSNEPVPGPETVDGITVGSRCEVSPGGRRGVVKFVGEIPDSPTGYWVGVQLDEPVGKGDGTAKGHKLFDCPDKYGSFVRGKNIKVGDYPERSLDDDDDDHNEENDKQDEDEF